MKAIIIAALLLLTAPRAEATLMTIVFDDNSTPFQHADWIGTYDLSIPAYSFPIGVCQNPLDCLYNIALFPGSNPGGPMPISIEFVTTGPSGGFGLGELGLLPGGPTGPRSWGTQNGLDTQFQRGGSYCIRGVDQGCQVPEPSALLLLLAGLAAIVLVRQMSHQI